MPSKILTKYADRATLDDMINRAAESLALSDDMIEYLRKEMVVTYDYGVDNITKFDLMGAD